MGVCGWLAGLLGAWLVQCSAICGYKSISRLSGDKIGKWDAIDFGTFIFMQKERAKMS